MIGFDDILFVLFFWGTIDLIAITLMLIIAKNKEERT